MNGAPLPAWIESHLPPGARHHDVGVDATPRPKAGVASTPARVGGLRMHAIEWGPAEGHAVVMVHGNPTWGFLWREVVRAVRARPGGDALRLIAPDLVGLGLSSKPPAEAHTLEHHAEWVGALLDQLVPGPLVLVAQDWGGAIGLRAMADRADRLRGLVLGNTVVGPPAKGFRPTTFHRLSQMPVVSDVLFTWLGLPLRALHLAQGDRDSIRGEIARAYRWPLRRRVDRAAPLALARMVPDSHTHPSIHSLARSEELYRSARIPVALVWGTRDPILGRVVNHLARLRPDATVVRTEAGHFLQEEVPDQLAEAVLDVTRHADWS